MDTASSPAFPVAHVIRLVAALLALAFVVLSLVAVLGPGLDIVLQPAPAEPLLGPFRWTARGLA